MEENNKKSIFRQKALSKVSSPEELDRYLMVTRPGIWFALSAVIVLLVGVIVWGFLGRIETTYQMAVCSTGDVAVCYVPLDKCKDVIEAGKIKIADKEYSVFDAGYSEDIVTESDMDAILASGGNLTAGQPVKPLKVEAKGLTKGVFYTGETVIESIKPISFIIN